MAGRIARIVVPTLIVLLLMASRAAAAPVTAKDVVIIRGTVSDLQGRPVRGSELRFFLDGAAIEAKGPVVSSSAGDYRAELALPPDSLPGGLLEVEARRHNYLGSGRLRVEKVVPAPGGEYRNAFFHGRS